jgi:hypothetical protein
LVVPDVALQLAKNAVEDFAGWCAELGAYKKN